MPSPAPEPLTPRPLTIWLANPGDDIPGECPQPTRTWSLARVLASRGHAVTWWTGTWSRRHTSVRQPPRDLPEEEGFAIRLVAVRPYDREVSLGRLASDRDFGRTFARLATEMIASGQMERPDLILAGLPPLEGPEVALRLARRLDATFVLDILDLWPETLDRLLPGPDLVRRLLAPVVFGGMRRRRDAIAAAADAVAATSRTGLEAVLPAATPGPVAGSPATPLLAAALLSSGVTGPREPAPTPRHVCYLGAYLQEFAVPRSPVMEVPVPGAESLPAPAARPLAGVCVGSRERRHDLDTLVKAAALLGERRAAVTIHIVDPGHDVDRLRRVAFGLRGSCQLVIHGPLDRRAYAELLGSCDVGLVCARPESRVGVSQTACDYAAAGLAIVTSLPGELAELLERHHAGLRVAPDASSWADAVAALAADRRRLSGLREGARRLAAAVFDRETTYARFADWLEAVTAGLPTDD
jgi:glycosyltransferase involved in cell wall biosynthesis